VNSFLLPVADGMKASRSFLILDADGFPIDYRGEV